MIGRAEGYEILFPSVPLLLFYLTEVPFSSSRYSVSLHDTLLGLLSFLSRVFETMYKRVIILMDLNLE